MRLSDAGSSRRSFGWNSRRTSARSRGTPAGTPAITARSPARTKPRRRNTLCHRRTEVRSSVTLGQRRIVGAGDRAASTSTRIAAFALGGALHGFSRNQPLALPCARHCRIIRLQHIFLYFEHVAKPIQGSVGSHEQERSRTCTRALLARRRCKPERCREAHPAKRDRPQAGVGRHQQGLFDQPDFRRPDRRLDRPRRRLLDVHPRLHRLSRGVDDRQRDAARTRTASIPIPSSSST